MNTDLLSGNQFEQLLTSADRWAIGWGDWPIAQAMDDDYLAGFTAAAAEASDSAVVVARPTLDSPDDVASAVQ